MITVDVNASRGMASTDGADEHGFFWVFIERLAFDRIRHLACLRFEKSSLQGSLDTYPHTSSKVIYLLNPQHLTRKGVRVLPDVRGGVRFLGEGRGLSENPLPSPKKTGRFGRQPRKKNTFLLRSRTKSWHHYRHLQG
jgi:hypothetical protein